MPAFWPLKESVLGKKVLFPFFFLFYFLAGLGLCGCAGFSLVETNGGALQPRSACSLQRLLLLRSLGSMVQGRQQLQLPGSSAQAL